MQLRTAVLLLLCVSAGMCATLVTYQTAASKEEAPAVTDVEHAAEDTTADDPPAAEEPEANSFFGNSVPAEVLAREEGAVDEATVDVSVADGATAEKPGTDGDSPDGDAPPLETFTGEAVTPKQPSSSSVEEGNNINPVQKTSPNRPLANEDSIWSLNSIRSSFQTAHRYVDSLVELVGGHNGVCQYRCRYGKRPNPRPGYRLSEADGCASSLMGFQLDLGIPAMTMCCNKLDVCYETCGTSKYVCDSEFRSCLHGICSDINKSLGFASSVQACGSMADTLYNTVWTLGCRSYMNSQRAACICDEEERDEL